jgi:Zn-finger nucleic acid-binding protein
VIYRDAGGGCPRCGVPLQEVHGYLHCGQCQGSLVPEADLRRLYATKAKVESFRLVPRGDDGLSLICPVCITHMDGYAINDIAIDRCGEHGFWFERGKLKRLVRSAVPEMTEDPWTQDVLIWAAITMADLDAKADDLEASRIGLENAIERLELATHWSPEAKRAFIETLRKKIPT